MEFYKDNIVKIGKQIDLNGWRVMPVWLDGVFKMYMAQAWMFFKPQTDVPYNQFVDTQAEFPLYFFRTWEEVKYFVTYQSPRYPYDRAMFWLRLHREYWFSTIAHDYLDYIQFCLDAKTYFSIKSKCDNGCH